MQIQLNEVVYSIYRYCIPIYIQLMHYHKVMFKRLESKSINTEFFKTLNISFLIIFFYLQLNVYDFKYRRRKSRKEIQIGQ